ncbi:hypothetical protein [Streptomyces sp. NBC_00620]|uniref:hypothetical protein n=1 Tax=Streptomyces sp. NBC_00620 TaxID=2903666 RepID=UPI0022550AC1|nr:hypothetical protein [Streptomyces sp. NBC_00620]MCX4972184.1 hypothetical protein [Streptomyces sp. NBC_00620]
MPATETAPPDAFALTDAEVDAIVTDAEQEAYLAAQRLRTAEETLRGEHGPVPDALTPAHLAELRATAEHAELKVPAAERRQAEIREARRQARHTEIKAQIRAEAASDLEGAPEILAAFDAYEAAARGLCETVAAHNERIVKWGKQMGAAGIHPIQGEGRAADALAHMVGGENVTIGHKVYRRMRAGTLLAVALHRVLAAYPMEMRKYNVDQELARDGELHDRTSGEPLNVHALIRRDS